MGMFDSVFAPCPVCGKLLEFQSKAGKCDLKKYTHTSVPAEIAADLIGADFDDKPYDMEHCCNKDWHLKAEIPRVSMNIVEWREDGEEEWD